MAVSGWDECCVQSYESVPRLGGGETELFPGEQRLEEVEVYRKDYKGSSLETLDFSAMRGTATTVSSESLWMSTTNRQETEIT
jgi:hypothetical protein